MSEKSRVGLIFGAVALLAGGGLYYYFKIYAPKQTRGVAQKEIVAWEERLDKVRHCLLGDKPASAKAGEALAVRELAPDPWDRGACTGLIGKLSRGIAEDSGIMKVEHAWMTVDRAASHVANAFATHVDPGGETADKRGKDSPLPGALDELDDARAQLREAAGMEPAPATGPAALPAAEMIALKEGTDTVSTLIAWTLPSSGGALAFGSVKGKGEVQLTLAPGAAPKVAKLPAAAVRAVPDGTWGAAGLREEVAIGTVDAAGAFGQMTHLPVELGARVLIAVGSFTDGLVAYATSNGLVLARAHGAAFVAEKRVDVGRIASAIDPGGRGLVAWEAPPGPKGDPESGPTRGFIATTGAAPTIVELGSGAPSSACLSATRGWVAVQDQLVGFDGKTATPHVLPEHELLGCTMDGALMHKYASAHFVVCNDTCREAEIASLRPTNVATIAGGKVIAIRTRGRVIGVWSEGVAPRFFATEKSVTPTLAYSDGKVVDVLGETEDAAVVVRIPLR